MRAEAVRLLDEFLAEVRHQSLLDGDKVRDFLLDLRILLSTPAVAHRG